MDEARSHVFHRHGGVRHRLGIICMATGAAAGFAAAQSLQQDCLPRDIDVKPVQQALGIDR